MWNITALQTGVEHLADVVCLHKPLRKSGDIGISHAAYEISKTKRGWMAIQKKSGLVVDERTDFSRSTNDDIIATDVRRRAEKMTRIVIV